jgi:hypothetical protein
MRDKISSQWTELLSLAQITLLDAFCRAFKSYSTTAATNCLQLRIKFSLSFFTHTNRTPTHHHWRICGICIMQFGGGFTLKF